MPRYVSRDVSLDANPSHPIGPNRLTHLHLSVTYHCWQMHKILPYL